MRKWDAASWWLFCHREQISEFSSHKRDNVSISAFAKKCFFKKNKLRLNYLFLDKIKYLLLVSYTPWKCTGAGNSKMSEIKQTRQKVGIVEQASLGKGRCKPSVSKVRWHEKNTEMQLASVGRKFRQPEVNWIWSCPEMWGKNKKVF